MADQIQQPQILPTIQARTNPSVNYAASIDNLFNQYFAAQQNARQNQAMGIQQGQFGIQQQQAAQQAQAFQYNYQKQAVGDAEQNPGGASVPTMYGQMQAAQPALYGPPAQGPMQTVTPNPAAALGVQTDPTQAPPPTSPVILAHMADMARQGHFGASSIMQGPAQGQDPQNGPGASQIAPGQPQQAPNAFQQRVAYNAAGQQMGAQTAYAGLQKAQADAGIAQAQAGMLNPQPGQPGIIQNIDQAQQNGTYPTDLSGMGRGDLANTIRVGLANRQASEGAPVVKMQAKNAAVNTSATTNAAYEAGADVQGKVRTAQSIKADAATLESIVSGLKSTDYQLINKVGLEAAAQSGNVPAQDALDQAKLVADRFQALVGGGSDAKLELGLNLFNAAKSAPQLKRSIQRINESLDNYSSSLRGKGTTVSPIPTSQQKAVTSPKGTTYTVED